MADYIQGLRRLVGNTKVIMVVAGAIVFNENYQVLLHRRSDNGYWGLPGGFMELGEKIEDTARREVYEETGIRLGKMELFGMYSNIEKVFGNGDQTSLVQIIFTCNDFEGELHTSDESLETKFFSTHSLPNNLYPDHMLFFEDLLSGEKPPFVK
ncbi:NUDIX hydrolase [Bacillus sp. FJAT-28004]|uniref:NUDIX hydrolase n=1 Tax=Bacillus sp. FJAT-28004 TaxID=1679165 RepID=UPI0006B5E951|nr:NUDIX domain-containing protein [Bacillus sp. FJAT-28004]